MLDNFSFDSKPSADIDMACPYCSGKKFETIVDATTGVFITNAICHICLGTGHQKIQMIATADANVVRSPLNQAVNVLNVNGVSDLAADTKFDSSPDGNLGKSFRAGFTDSRDQAFYPNRKPDPNQNNI